MVLETVEPGQVENEKIDQLSNAMLRQFVDPVASQNLMAIPEVVVATCRESDDPEEKNAAMQNLKDRGLIEKSLDPIKWTLTDEGKRRVLKIQEENNQLIFEQTKRAYQQAGEVFDEKKQRERIEEVQEDLKTKLDISQ